MASYFQGFCAAGARVAPLLESLAAPPIPRDFSLDRGAFQVPASEDDLALRLLRPLRDRATLQPPRLNSCARQHRWEHLTHPERPESAPNPCWSPAPWLVLWDL